MQQAELSIMPLNNFCFDLADDILEFKFTRTIIIPGILRYKTMANKTSILVD